MRKKLRLYLLISQLSNINGQACAYVGNNWAAAGAVRWNSWFTEWFFPVKTKRSRSVPCTGVYSSDSKSSGQISHNK